MAQQPEGMPWVEVGTPWGAAGKERPSGAAVMARPWEGAGKGRARLLEEVVRV